MEERLKNVMGQVLVVPADSIKEDSSNENIETWDSVAQLTLILALEDEFDIEFEVDQIQALVSYVLLKDAIENML